MPLKFLPRETGLRTRLLVPRIALVAVAAFALAFLQEVSARRQAEFLIEERGATVLESVAWALRERQRDHEVYVELLAANRGIISALDSSPPDIALLNRELARHIARLGLQDVIVFSANGVVLTLPATDKNSSAAASLVTSAMSGLTESFIDMGEGGVTVMASTPIRGNGGLLGAIVSRTTLDSDELQAISNLYKTELAVFLDGRIVATSIGRPDLLAAIDISNMNGERLRRLNQTLQGLYYHSTSKPVGDRGLLVALIPIEDLLEATRYRSIIASLVTALVLLGILGTGPYLARDIARPLETFVTQARELVLGNYGRRIAPGRIRELNEMALAFNRLAEQLNVQRRALERQAFYDPVTGLPNRALFMNRVEHALARSFRRGHRIAVMFLDLDNFKLVNDSLGHQIGDKLLKAVAGRLLESIRVEDTAARLGGDEFTLLVEDFAEDSSVTIVADRLQVLFNSPYDLDGHEVFVTGSIGIAFSTSQHEDAESLLRDADMAMYRAKLKGKARYEIFNEGMKASVQERLGLETDLRRALERGEMVVHYQPVVSLETGAVTEIEAQLCWMHPGRGLMQSHEFGPLAEETGMIVPIGYWGIQEACREICSLRSRWPNAALAAGLKLTTKQLQQPDLVEKISGILKEERVDGRGLQLELRIGAVMQDMEAASSSLRRFKQHGIRLAVDDFGSGYSSIAYLRRFPVDELRLDRSLVSGLGRDRRDTNLVQAAIKFAKALNLTVTAKGIETARQLDVLGEAGCDQVTGPFISPALPGSHLAGVLYYDPDSRLVKLLPAAERQMPAQNP